jgi:hypothetical protein
MISRRKLGPDLLGPGAGSRHTLRRSLGERTMQRPARDRQIAIGCAGGSQHAPSVSHAKPHGTPPSDGSRLLRKLTAHSKNSRRDGGIRTRGLLLPNQLQSAAGRSPASPDVPSSWNNAGLTSPEVA